MVSCGCWSNSKSQSQFLGPLCLWQCLFWIFWIFWQLCHLLLYEIWQLLATFGSFWNLLVILSSYHHVVMLSLLGTFGNFSTLLGKPARKFSVFRGFLSIFWQLLATVGIFCHLLLFFFAVKFPHLLETFDDILSSWHFVIPVVLPPCPLSAKKKYKRNRVHM